MTTADTRPIPPSLQNYWDKPLSTFATLPAQTIDPGQQERYRIYSLLIMAIVSSQWNGNKYGDGGDGDDDGNGAYGVWRTGQILGKTNTGRTLYSGGTYLGHNIAALAVDGTGRVIDFDFNHNSVFNSSVEHAESRLVRRLFALDNVSAPWESEAAPIVSAPTKPGQHFAFDLQDVTIYTSLESCAQCSGIMTLASVKEIVYLQRDQGQFLIGNMMWNATHAIKEGFYSPLPIAGDQFAFPYFDQLNAANDDFDQRVATEPFYKWSPTVTSNTGQITSYLCTDSAAAIYEAAAKELLSMSVSNPGYAPQPSGGSSVSVLTNAQSLLCAQDFYKYALELDNRGTAHRV